MGIYEIFGHLAYILIACSLLVRDILWLRCLSILASVSSIVFNYYVPAAPLWLVIEWNVVFIGINAVRIGIILKEKMGVSFSPEEEELYETMFRNFSAVEFMKLMRLGQWREVEPGETLATEGKELASLVLIYNGAAGVRMKGEEVAVLKDGNFIGEMSFTTSGPASATVAAVAATRVVEWPKEELKKLLQRNPSMRSAIQAVLSGDMARKLIEQSTGDGRDGEAD